MVYPLQVLEFSQYVSADLSRTRLTKGRAGFSKEQESFFLSTVVLETALPFAKTLQLSPTKD